MNPWHEEVLYLRRTELLSGLDESALEKIAAKLRRSVYLPGAVILKEGAAGEALYMILRGHVEVKKREPSLGLDLTIATLSEGACFGEMALLTGNGRSATVIAIDST